MDTVITFFILSVAFFISIAFQNVFDVEEHISTLFAFAVFLVSLLTKGYVYGICSAFIGTLAINYAFTFPYFAFNFTIPVNLISAIAMVTIALLTGALTTKIKHHEAIKAENEKERTRANLLRAVSHDLRTPLTSIYGSASALSEHGDTLNKKEKEAMLESIKQDSEWLIRMVENLLSVTRIDGGNVKLKKTDTVLEELVSSVLVKFNKRYPNFTVEVDIPQDIMFIPMDAMLIEQVLINLLENVVIHGKKPTKASLRVRKKDSVAIFEIKDDGGGIPETKLAKLFEGGCQESSIPADSQKKNAGIGLSVCAAIIKAHGGSIWARNVNSGALIGFKIDTEEANDE